ncbi:MAG: glycoside hydrolase family 92 protein [Deltaproteobacteria bacterium]|nr:glycoside hydrolase family 92 protein [Deltaproteobacteria bacterium]
MRNPFPPLCFLLAAACTPGPAPRRYRPLEPPTDAPLAALVDPFVGTANDGQTLPGAVVPWGMASPSPHTTLRDPFTFLDGPANAGYLHGEPLIRGFGQTHLSGVGCPDLGAPVLVPIVGSTPGFTEDTYASAYTGEHAHAGYYAVSLTGPGVDVELTATSRVGLQRFWFPDRDDAAVLIDVGRSLSWRTNAGRIRVVSTTEAEGSVELGLFCARPNHPVLHFVVRFDHPAFWAGTFTSESFSGATDAEGDAGAFFRFRARAGDPLVAAVGLSWVGVDGARAALDREVGARSFDELHDDAGRAWQAVLERVRVRGDETSTRRFTTALYHALLHPSLASDVGGDYPLGGGAVGHLATGDRYTVFSMWDTYRTVHPLLTLLYPERQAEMLRTLESLTAATGAPPRWELIGEDVDMMVGDPLAIVVADSWTKGLAGVELDALYLRLAAAARDPTHRAGLVSYETLGYVPMEESSDVWGPVSTTLEYALADSALAALAGAAGRSGEATEFAARAQSWRSLFDPATGLLRPRNADGSWFEPFDPDALDGSSFQPRSGGPGYVEGSAWQYAFFVPHDIPGLVALHGEAAFVSRLQAIFDSGRFAMWNEPDLADPYLFDYVPGNAFRTQLAVRDAMGRFFGDGPAGLPGNDDAGTLSAWYVFSAMGFYPDAPGSSRYALGSPLFDRIELDLSPAAPGSRTFVVDALGNGPDRPYVASAELNDVPLTEPFLEHGDIVAGGVLTLHMSATPGGW